MADLKDLHDSIEVDVAYYTTGITADTNGTTIDLLGFNGCEFIVHVGETGGTCDASNYWTLEIEEATDNAGSAGTWSDVAETDLIDPISGTTTGAFALIDDEAEDVLVYRVGYRGIARFVRVVFNVTASPGSTPFTALAVKCNPVYMPTTNP